MSKPVVFWRQKKTSFIMLPADPNCQAPAGFDKIECIHAHEADKWSSRLRDQEKRLREMSEEERYNFEEPIRSAMLRELEDNFRKANDPVNREFIAASIKLIKERRARQQTTIQESYMRFESKEGVAS
jgi:hypothetical protein